MMVVNIVMMKIIFLSGAIVVKNERLKKTSIKEELMLITWYPSRYCDWFMLEDEKKETEKLWA